MNLKSLLILLIAILIGFTASAQTDTNKTQEKKGLNVGEFIIEHVSDAYEWHITKIGKTEISIPLPVILYTKDKGLVTFMFSKLKESPTHEYNGFFINEENGIYKGKIMEKMPDGSIKRPFDISISKDVLALLMVSIFLLWIFISIANRYKKNPDKAPKGLQSLLEPIIIFVRDEIAKSAIGKHYEKYMPYLLTIFFFIFINNLMGIIPIFPGGYNLTGNITVTMVLALFTFAITTFSGTKHYWQDIFWSPTVPWWLKAPLPIMPLVEILGVFTKPFVLMVRLFANIIGGHIVMLAFFSLIFIFGQISVVAGYGVSVFSIAFTLFDSLLEILVALIQAFVFTLLSAIYFGMALEGSEEHH